MKRRANGYEVVVDTKGALLWNDDNEEEKSILIITHADVSSEYIDYLDCKNISWIACGHGSVDLNRACEILYDTFEVRRMAIVGGGHINGGFFNAGLIDEVSILIGAGIDGREGMTAIFDGLPTDKEPIPLKIKKRIVI